jgi:hypothetical protein
VSPPRSRERAQAGYAAAIARHPDIIPEDLAEAGRMFHWDFDRAADEIRLTGAMAAAEHAHVGKSAEAVYRLIQPATLGDAVRQFVSGHSS